MRAFIRFCWRSMFGCPASLVPKVGSLWVSTRHAEDFGPFADDLGGKFVVLASRDGWVRFDTAGHGRLDGGNLACRVAMFLEVYREVA